MRSLGASTAVLVTLGLACVEPEPTTVPIELAEPEPPRLERLGPTPVAPAPSGPPTNHDEVSDWLGCHPSRIARFEFGDGETELADRDAARAMLRAEIDVWPSYPEHEQPIKILVLGYSAPDEGSTVSLLRAVAVYELLIGLGVDRELCLVDGSTHELRDHAPRSVDVLLLQPISCIL